MLARLLVAATLSRSEVLGYVQQGDRAGIPSAPVATGDVPEQAIDFAPLVSRFFR